MIVSETQQDKSKSVCGDTVVIYCAVYKRRQRHAGVGSDGDSTVSLHTPSHNFLHVMTIQYVMLIKGWGKNLTHRSDVRTLGSLKHLGIAILKMTLYAAVAFQKLLIILCWNSCQFLLIELL